jgi:hypothetical protein
MLEIRIDAQNFSRMAVAVMTPTPAGKKNNAILLVSVVALGLISSAFTILSKSDAKRRSIPITLPGIKPPMRSLSRLPMVKNKKITKSP